MLIGIDGNEANISQRVGVGRYAYELLDQLFQLRVVPPMAGQAGCGFKIYLKNRPLADLPKENDWWQYKMVRPKKFWTQIGLPLALWAEQLAGKAVDVFFTPGHYAPRFCPVPRVISIMDLCFWNFPQMYKKQDYLQLKNWTAYSVAKAQKILTISSASKRDIIKYYQVNPDKIAVTYPGYRMKKMPAENQIKRIRKKYRLKNDYLLSVGTLQPRKNYVRLVQAFSQLKQKLDLVIVGKKGWLWEEILAAPQKYHVADRVKFLDYVSDLDLAALYQGAAAFVLVSLYEGFGLPVLEALNYGCPVVTSNLSSLPEVAGEAGILVDPEKTDSIKQGLEKVLSLNQEQRQALAQKGIKQAKKFSWEKCARETLAVLEEAGGKDV